MARNQASERHLRLRLQSSAAPTIGRPVEGSKRTPTSSTRSMATPAHRGQAQHDNRHNNTKELP
jgi:hypothetical protein